MCRTLRGGRAEAITTFTLLPGRQRNACTVWALTCLLEFSRVPSRSMATSLIGYSDMEIPGADSSHAFALGTTGGAVVLLIFFFDDLGDDLRTWASLIWYIWRSVALRSFGALRAMLLS